MTHATHALAAEPSSHGFRGSAIVNRIDRARIYESIPYSLPLPEHLAGLLHQLANARTVEPDRIPPDLVTMNSVVRTLAPRTGASKSTRSCTPTRPTSCRWPPASPRHAARRSSAAASATTPSGTVRVASGWF